MLTLSPQLPDFARAWVAEDGIEFPVLLDLGNGVARDFGLTFRLPDDLIEVYLNVFKIDLTRFDGDESWEVPIPATYVVDPGGRIVYASVDPDYTTRPEPTELLTALDALT